MRKNNRYAILLLIVGYIMIISVNWKLALGLYLFQRYITNKE
jgi:hypothetical protein